jgi:DNA primase large subunit
MFGLVTKKRLEELQEKYDSLQRRIEDCIRIENKSKELNDEINLLNRKITELKGQIREQTEADLFFVSAKIQNKLLDGEPKKNVYDLGLQQLALQQQMQQQSYNPGQSFGGGLLQQLFGGRY